MPGGQVEKGERGHLIKMKQTWHHSTGDMSFPLRRARENNAMEGQKRADGGGRAVVGDLIKKKVQIRCLAKGGIDRSLNGFWDRENGKRDSWGQGCLVWSSTMMATVILDCSNDDKQQKKRVCGG